MKVEIIRIGNSRGIRLPKTLLEQCGFKDTAELSVKDGMLVLSPVSQVRTGWQEQFAQASDEQREADLEELLPDTASREWDDEQWHW